jgi:hypothetical protein
MLSNSGRLLAVILAGVAIAGCNSRPTEKLVPVSGRALVDGKPVPAGNITFYPDRTKDNKTGHQPMGIIEANGRYELFVPVGRKGAPEGWYRVVVYAVDDPQPGKPNKYFVAKDYADVETTPLRVEVSASAEPGRYDLKLQP